METVETLSDELRQDELCTIIAGHLQSAYAASVKLTDVSLVSKEEREKLSQGLYLMRENVMIALALVDVNVPQ